MDQREAREVLDKLRKLNKILLNIVNVLKATEAIPSSRVNDKPYLDQSLRDSLSDYFQVNKWN